MEAFDLPSTTSVIIFVAFLLAVGLYSRGKTDDSPRNR